MKRDLSINSKEEEDQLHSNKVKLENELDIEKSEKNSSDKKNNENNCSDKEKVKVKVIKCDNIEFGEDKLHSDNHKIKPQLTKKISQLNKFKKSNTVKVSEVLETLNYIQDKRKALKKKSDLDILLKEMEVSQDYHKGIKLQRFGAGLEN